MLRQALWTFRQLCWGLFRLSRIVYLRYFRPSSTVRKALFSPDCDEELLAVGFIIVSRTKRYPLTTLKLFRKCEARETEFALSSWFYIQLLGDAGKRELQREEARKFLKNKAYVAGIGAKTLGKIELIAGLQAGTSN